MSSTSSNPAHTKVGLLFSGSMRAEMVELIANTIQSSRDTDFYLITDREVKSFVPVIDTKLGRLLSIRRDLMRNIHGGGISEAQVNDLIKTNPKLVKDMVFVADSQEQGKILTPLVNASGKRAVILVEPEMEVAVLDEANIPESARVLLQVPNDPLKSIALADSVAKITMSNRPVANDHVSIFARELEDADVVPVVTSGNLATQGIGDSKSFYNLYDAKTDTVTFVGKAKKVTYIYTAKSGKLTANVEGRAKDYDLTKEQDTAFTKKLGNFDKIVAGPKMER